MELNELGRNYFYTTREAFEAFIGEQVASPSLRAALEAAREANAGVVPVGTVIIEFANEVAFVAPKPRDPRAVLVSRRKHGPRGKKEATEASATEESVDTPKKSRRTRSAAE